MPATRAFFSKIRALFSYFWKRAKETSPISHFSYALVTRLSPRSISLDVYGSKIRKGSICIPVASNETSDQAGVLYYKSSYCTKHKWHYIVGYFINTAFLNVYFMLHYYLLFRKEFYFFECLRSSEYNIRIHWICFLAEIRAIS